MPQVARFFARTKVEHQETIAEAQEKKSNASSDIFAEAADVELEHKLYFSATLYWIRSCRDGDIG